MCHPFFYSHLTGENDNRNRLFISVRINIGIVFHGGNAENFSISSEKIENAVKNQE